MAKFTDGNGLDWSVRIRLGDLYAFREETAIDFFSAIMTQSIPPTDLLTLAWVSVRKQAKQRGFNEIKAWLNGIGKQSLEPLLAAVGAELEEFFPVRKAEGDGPDPPKANPGDGKMSSDTPPTPE